MAKTFLPIFFFALGALFVGCEETPRLNEIPPEESFQNNPDAQASFDELTRGGRSLPTAAELTRAVSSPGRIVQEAPCPIEEAESLTLLSVSTQGRLTPTDLPNLRNGCRSINTCGQTNNLNLFTDSAQQRQAFERSGGCSGGSLSCPPAMTMVCSAEYHTKVCVDVDLKKEADGTPEGNHTFHTCQRYCQSRGARLLTNNEWLVAAAGTRGEDCLPSAQQRNAVRIDTSSSRSMGNLDHNRRGMRADRSACVSAFGIRDAVGVLGQWVTDGQARSNRAQFNGGLWRQGASTLFYRTTAHGPGYTDYSIGCRCAAAPQ